MVAGQGGVVQDTAPLTAFQAVRWAVVAGLLLLWWFEAEFPGGRLVVGAMMVAMAVCSWVGGTGTAPLAVLQDSPVGSAGVLLIGVGQRPAQRELSSWSVQLDVLDTAPLAAFKAVR
jgi:hypothetical protein